MSRGSLPPLEDDFSRALLGSAEADGPSNAAYAKAAAALGIGVGLGVGASLPAPAAALAVGAAGVAGVARWSSSLGAKLLALGVSGALIVGAGVLLWAPPQAAKPAAARAGLAPTAHTANATQPTSDPARTPASPEATHERPGSSLGSSPVANSLTANAAQASPTPTVRPFAVPAARRLGRALSASALPARGSSASGSPARASSTRPSSGSSLAEQVQSLDRARVALGSGDSSSALREISHYRQAWPDGVFLTEASVLEIEALAARGERSLAATRAADFVAAHPDSPQAGRLRALIPAKKR